MINRNITIMVNTMCVFFCFFLKSHLRPLSTFSEDTNASHTFIQKRWNLRSKLASGPSWTQNIRALTQMRTVVRPVTWAHVDWLIFFHYSHMTTLLICIYQQLHFRPFSMKLSPHVEAFSISRVPNCVVTPPWGRAELQSITVLLMN